MKKSLFAILAMAACALAMSMPSMAAPASQEAGYSTSTTSRTEVASVAPAAADCTTVAHFQHRPADIVFSASAAEHVAHQREFLAYRAPASPAEPPRVVLAALDESVSSGSILDKKPKKK